MQEEVSVQEETSATGADEIYCPSCGSAIGRGLAVCPQCGRGIPFELQGVSAIDTRQFRQPGTQRRPTYAPPERDEAGAGRYILNFLLAGLIGLGLTYFLREHGWLATFICIPIFILAVWVLSSSGATP